MTYDPSSRKFRLGPGVRVDSRPFNMALGLLVYDSEQVLVQVLSVRPSVHRNIYNEESSSKVVAIYLV